MENRKQCILCGAVWDADTSATRPDVGAQLDANTCPGVHPERCGGQLGPQVVRLCRLDEAECHRRCSSKPGGCDIYGQGLESDGKGTRLAGRRVVDGPDGIHVELDLEAVGL